MITGVLLCTGEKSQLEAKWRYVWDENMYFLGFNTCTASIEMSPNISINVILDVCMLAYVIGLFSSTFFM